MKNQPPAILGRRSLSRRTFLRSGAATIALPWLSAMAPALPAPGPKSPVRALWVFAPNGMKMDEWKPDGSSGALGTLPYLLEPLAPLRSKLLVVSGLDLDGAKAHGDGPGDHARSAAAFLTTAHPRKTGGSDIQAGISVDQVLAGEIGHETVLPSLEIGMEPGRASGVCDSGYSCAYSNNVSWRSPSLPLPKETSPRRIFARLFGDPDLAASSVERAVARRRRRSILDLSLDEAKRLRGKLGAADAAKVDEYLGGVRDLEVRIAREEESSAQAVPVPPELRGAAVRRSSAEHLRLLYDLVALAWQADRTRIVTFMLGNGGSNRSYPHIDVTEGHHDLSHHGKDPAKLAPLRRINRFHCEEFARFGQKLATIEDGDGSLLDHSFSLLGSGISDGDRHNHDDLPIIVLGSGGGLPGGRHMVVKKKVPLANLHLALLRRAGSQAKSFGDSTEALL